MKYFMFNNQIKTLNKMVINVHRIKREVSTKNSSIVENMVKKLISIFDFDTDKKTVIRAKVRTAMIMY